MDKHNERKVSLLMEKLMFIETGMGIDVHGQDITKAAIRAVKNAIHYNSMPGIRSVLPGNSLDNMIVNVKLAVPCEKESLDIDAVKEALPFGKVSVEVMDGGMLTTSGIVLEEKGDKNDLMYIVVASVEVGY
jgi:uncharacterized protein (TIGR02058 family)